MTNLPRVFTLLYPAKIVAVSDHFDFKHFLNNTLEQIFKQAILKHFEGHLPTIDIKIAKITNALSSAHLPINFTLELITSVELLASDVTISIAELAVNTDEKCQLDVSNKSVTCVNGGPKNDFESLYRVSDLWIQLVEGLPKSKSKIHYT